MASNASRIAKLELATPEDCPAFEQFVGRLPPLDEHGNLDWLATDPQFAEAFGPWLTDTGNKTCRFRSLSDATERGLADILTLFNDSIDPFVFERYRGRVPDRVLAACYNDMRNHAFAPDVAFQVRQRAGLVDQSGSLMSGYVLHENGCITDAKTEGHG